MADVAAHAGAATALAVVVPAEGTRAKGEYWKSGFYRIAREAKVPIVLSYLDGPSRTGGFGPTIHPSGDVKADMDLIRAFYAGQGRREAREQDHPRLRDEEGPPVPDSPVAVATT